MILLLTAADDRGSDAVVGGLAARGATAVLFDPAELPGQASLSVRRVAGGWRRRIVRADGSELDLDAVRGIWFRNPSPPDVVAVGADERTSRYLAMEWRDVLHDLWRTLGCFWLPGPFDRLLAGEGKIHQLMVAAAHGLRVPDTVVTSWPADLLEHASACDGDVITKAAGSRALGVVFGDALARFTEPLSRRDVAAWRSVRLAPLLVQRRIPKHVEIRVTIVGKRAFAAEIDSQASHHGRVDWRRYDLRSTPVRPHVLPGDVEQRCLGVAATLGLDYGAIDLIRSPDGEYTFLELNPTGQYGWIEDATGLPITDAICDLLVARCTDG